MNDIRDLEAILGRLPTANELAEYRGKKNNHGVCGYDRDQASYDVREAQNHRRLTSSEAFERKEHIRKNREAGGN